jgi:hypothetical protein
MHPTETMNEGTTEDYQILNELIVSGMASADNRPSAEVTEDEMALIASENAPVDSHKDIDELTSLTASKAHINFFSETRALMVGPIRQPTVSTDATGRIHGNYRPVYLIIFCGYWENWTSAWMIVRANVWRVFSRVRS